MNANERELFAKGETSPLKFWLLKIDQKSELKVGNFQVIDALRKMLVEKALNALQFHDEPAFNNQIRDVMADFVASVEDWKTTCCWTRKLLSVISSSNARS